MQRKQALLRDIHMRKQIIFILCGKRNNEPLLLGMQLASLRPSIIKYSHIHVELQNSSASNKVNIFGLQ